jgi:acetyl-CoA carboxylase biotin carboxyl carrier protein
MDLEEIRKIIKLMDDNNLVEFELEKEGIRVSLKKGQPLLVSPAASLPTVLPQNVPLPQLAADETEAAEEGDIIVSPMVGTFYAAASPDSPPYVTEGQKVEPTDIVCIIEAMKVMNEIPADVEGTIVDILVSNGEPVEYGQELFRVKKD